MAEASSGTGTARFRVADFDAATNEIIYWTFIVPSDMASDNWLPDIGWFANSTTNNADAIWRRRSPARARATLIRPPSRLLARPILLLKMLMGRKRIV